MDDIKKIVVFDFLDTNTKEIYKYNEILEVSIVEDEKTIAKISKFSQLHYGKGNNNTKQEVDSLNLVIKVKDSNSPVKTISFLPIELNKEITKQILYKKTDNIYINAKQEIEKWFNDLRDILKYIDQPEKIIQKSTIKKSTQSSLADKKNNSPEIMSDKQQAYGCGFLILVLVIILFTSCGLSSGTNYQPGDFDFDGDSGDIDDATNFLQWKINEEE